MLNFNGYQVEPGAIINTFVSSFDNSSINSGNGADFADYQELTLTCSTLSNDDNVDWMVINSSSNDSYTVNKTIVDNTLSNLTVRISKGELTIACISEEYNDSISITITTGTYVYIGIYF